MARCGCSKTCTCFVDQNGATIIAQETDVLAGTVSLMPSSRIGWRDNVVTGSGRQSDPYVVSFKDSLEYRPPAQELRQTGPNFYNDGWVVEPTVYSTPAPKALFFWVESFPGEIQAVGSGFIIGAWANIDTGGVAAPIEMVIVASIVDISGPFNIAGASTQTVNPKLACSGYVNPVDSAVSIGSTGVTTIIVLQFFDPASAIVSVSDVRLWGVEV